jgi:Family of unknown function (DUF5677)
MMTNINLSPSDQKYYKMIVYLEHVLERVENEILKRELSDSDTQKLLLFSLILSIMELTKSAIVLLNKKIHISIPTILRNILEAHVDLKNLAANLEYKNVMYTSYLAEQKRLLENQESHTELERTMLEYINLLFEKYKKNINKTKLSSRFNSAGLRFLYNSLYNKLCRETHNNINCLIQRHFDNKTELEQLKYKKEKELNDIAFYSYSMIDIIHKSLVILGQFNDFKKSKNLKEIVILKNEFKDEFQIIIEDNS